MVAREKKRVTDHTSFRINNEVLKNLKSVAKEEKLSLNTLVNQIFSSHLNWDLYAPQVGWVVMLKDVLIELVKAVDKESIVNAAKKAAESSAKEIALYMRGNYGIDEWISILHDRARMSGFKLKEYSENNKTKLIMHHEMGENWSLFFTKYYETIFFDLGTKVTTDYTENTIIIELEKISSSWK